MSIEKKYDIQNIKNLEMIYFYDISKSEIGRSTSSFLGLKVVYDNGKGLGYDVTSDYFSEFLQKVVDVYNLEKSTRKIDFLNEFSKQMIESIDVKKFVKNKRNYNEKNSLIEVKTVYNTIKEIDDYIKEVCKNILSFILKDHKIDIICLKGCNNRFSAIYTVDDLEQRILCLVVKKVSDNKYEFTADYVSDELFSVDGSIVFDDAYVNIFWENESDDIKATYKYNIDDNLSERNIKRNQKIIDFNTIDDSVDKNLKSLLDFYIKEILNDEIDSCISTVNNNYLLSQTTFLDGDTENEHLYKNSSCHFNLKKDFVRLKYHKVNGVSKKDDKILVPFNEVIEEKLLKHYEINGEDYVVVETKEKPSYIDFDRLEHKDTSYYYDILKVNGFKDFTSKFNITEKMEIESNQDKKLLLRLVR